MKNKIIIRIAGILILLNLISCQSGPLRTPYQGIGMAEDEAKEVLQSLPAGRLLTNSGTYPQAFFTEYAYNDKNNFISLTAPAGSPVIDCLKKYSKVSFAVDRYNERIWESVHVFGNAALAEENTGTVKVIIIPELITGRLGVSLYHPFRKLPRLVLNQEQQIVPVPAGAPKADRTDWETGELPPTVNAEFRGASREISESYLRRHSAGRVNTLGADYPYSVPLNFAYFDGKIYFHSKKENSLKVKNITANPNVSFSIEWFGNELPWTDICIAGRARIIDKFEEMYAAMQKMSVVLTSPDGKLPDNYAPPELKAEGGHGSRAGGFGGMVVIEITPESVTLTRKNTSGPASLKMPWIINHLQ